MLTFALVAARPGRQIPAGVREKLAASNPREVPFAPSAHHVWQVPNGRVVCAGWQSGAAGRPDGDCWYEAGGGLTAISGRLWPSLGTWRSDAPQAPQLAAWLRSRALEADDFRGFFTALSVGPGGDGLAVNDFCGLSLMYFASNRDVQVVSSRASLAARIAATAGAPSRDLLGVGWLAYTGGSLYGTRTGFEGVAALPAGSSIRVDQGGIRVERDRPRPWLPAGTVPGCDESENLVDCVAEVQSDIALSIREAASRRGSRFADLTGGMDSRLVLAVMLAEGLEDTFEFQTSGSPELPDVAVATRMARELGLRHRVGPTERDRAAMRDLKRSLRAKVGGDVSARELAVRAAVGASSGMRIPAQPVPSRPPTDDRVVVSGIFGEALATNWSHAHRLRSRRDVGKMLRLAFGHGRLGILRPDAADYYRNELLRCALDDYERDSAGVIIDSFWIEHRFRRWFGPVVEMNEKNLVAPLYTPVGVRAAFAMGSARRHERTLHFEVMRRADDRIATMPFAHGGWDPDMLKARGVFATHQRAAGPPPNRKPIRVGRLARTARRLLGRRLDGQRTVGIERRERHEEGDLEVMRTFLADDPANPVYTVLDRKAVQRRLDRFATLDADSKDQLRGALTAAIWMADAEILPGEDTG